LTREGKLITNPAGKGAVIDVDLYFALVILVLFFCYGFSNLYIIAFLGKKGGHEIGLVEFVTIFMGNIKNYVNLNKRFRDTSELDGSNPFFNKCISIIHLCSPVLIIISILVWVVTISF